MKPSRKSTFFLCSLAALVLLFAVMCVHARVRQAAEMAGIGRMAAMVREVGLTDLCLFTEASYTRNPSQTDLQTPFQEHPVSLEHFPSGSLMPPPEHQKDNHAAIH
ncbi:MAG TPA: hypothetical protein VJ161_07800 [Geobacteraceae bacterium]|nr:hypothetical protein [Geobacteraceae bacterium]